MWTVDLIAAYLYALKFVVIVVAVLMLISGIDDLFIDIVYWVRRAWRATFVYRTHDRLQAAALSAPDEKPLAIMVPAWNETGVIRQMAELAVTTLDYENYHIFVGTYPNDPDTQRDVDEVCARFRNVHKVVCARPGPTSKADCLNNVLDAILQFERRAKLQFAGFILHDAEDVISQMELRLFNYLVDRKDLIQLPVYPFARHWSDFTSGHYMDEFAEVHGKDVLVREALAGQVPSAGVGTCFSRRAVMALLADGDGVAFDVQSLTEDYDIGFRLKTKGMTEIFVRFPLESAAAVTDGRPVSHRRTGPGPSVICVQEYFPSTVATAVRQKSRWIVGIVYQGLKTLQWTNSLTLNYFLWRDRKGALTNFVSLLAMVLLLHWVVLWVYQAVAPHPYEFLSAFEGGRVLTLLLQVNLVLMTNRLVQRFIFVSSFYGVVEGIWSLPRVVWGNLINFLANCRAIRQIVQYGDVRRVAWDKTTHEFPTLGEAGRARRPLGRILVSHGVIDEEQLFVAIVQRPRGLRLGSALVRDGRITPRQLAAAVAEQSGVSWEDVDTLSLDRRVIEQLPADLAAHYEVLPLREHGRTLVLASEGELDPVSAAALGRKLKRPVAYVIVPIGQVTVGLRHWYLQQPADVPRRMLDEAVAAGALSPARATELWQEYVSQQLLFAEILMSLGHLDRAALTAVLLRHDRAASSLGEYMVSLGIISAAAIDEALELQETLQGSMDALLEREHVMALSRV